jgi:hypothetical protein
MTISGARFRKCANEDEVDTFYNELSIGTLSLESSPSTSSIEPKALFSEPDPPLLNRFRMAIERKNNEQFEERINDNPRFLLNTSSDSPTIIQGAQR